MNTSQTIEKIAPALHKAQIEMKGAVKDSTNPHFKSKYADLGSVIDAVKSALHKHGIVYVQGVEDADNGVAIETRLIHTSGEWISSTLRIPATKQDAQGYGSAITYGRRYGLQAMCGVPAEDDDGNAATATAPAKITPRAGAWEALAPDVQTQLQDIADCVRTEFNTKGAEAAFKLLSEESDHAKLGQDERVALWDRFSAPERGAMAKAAPKKEERKAA